MKKLILISGFPRGGTSFLRDCLASHLKVTKIPKEIVYKDLNSFTIQLKENISILTKENKNLIDKFFVNKAPANLKYLDILSENFKETKFIVILRDPKDVFVSHKEGLKPWMMGKNKDVKFVINKLEKYYEGLQKIKQKKIIKNIHVLRYEDLHQNFTETLKKIFDFCNIKTLDDDILSIFKKNHINFKLNEQYPKKAKRKGVIGEWAIKCNQDEKNYFKENKFINYFNKHYYYSNLELSYPNIIEAMNNSNKVNFLSEDDLINENLDKKKINVSLQHDIDFLNSAEHYKSVAGCSELEKKYNIPAIYNFLPLDDRRYSPSSKKKITDLIFQIKETNKNASIGLHMNCCEKFVVSENKKFIDDPDIVKLKPLILDYAQKIIDDYDRQKVKFKTSTAHGFGYKKKLPNNRDFHPIAELLEKNKIYSFDNYLGPKLINNSDNFFSLTDTGGFLKIGKLKNKFLPNDPRFYECLEENTFIRFLTHPGNYFYNKPYTVKMKMPN